MSFYRAILAVVAAAAIATPVFADDTATTATGTTATQGNTDTMTQSTDNNATQQVATAGDTAKVDLNAANVKDLMKVQGIDASKARAIVDYRKKHGNFTTIDDLTKVKGFTKLKPDTMKKITDQVSVN